MEHELIEEDGMQEYLDKFLLHQQLLRYHEPEGQFPEFEFKDTSIYVIGHWRVLYDGTIIVGQDDPEPMRMERTLPLQGSVCERVTVDVVTRELSVYLSSGHIVQVSSMSSQYETYNISTTHGDVRVLVGGPGNSWCAF